MSSMSNAKIRIFASIFTPLLVLIHFHAKSCDGTSFCFDPDSVRMLKEVIVVKELNERRGNRESITVTKQMRDRARDAGEMLAGLTGIFYDPMSTEVKYLGSDKVVILVDSVQKSAAYIKRMNPKRFDRIDIISFPDGKYAGYDAVINYHTKPQYVGYDGVVKGEAIILPTGYNGQGKELYKSNDVADFTYTRERLNIAVTGTYDFMQNGSTDYYIISYPFNYLTESSIERKKRDPATDILTRSVNANASLDYQINNNHSLSLTYGIRPQNNRTSNRMNFEMAYADDVSDTVGVESYSRDKGLYHKIGVFYRGKLKNRWNLDGTLSYNFSEGDYYYMADRTTGYRTNYKSHFNSNYFWGGFDLTHSSHNRKWSYGLSDYVTTIRFHQTRVYGNAVESKTEELRNRTTINLNYYPNRSVSLGGYVGVNTIRRSNVTFRKTYFGARGRVWANWFVGRGNGLMFNYTVQNIYPGLGQIQDYGYFRDSLIYTKGNPELRPATNHNFTLTGFMSNGLTARVDYSLTASECFMLRELGRNMEGKPGFPEYYVVETFYTGMGRNLKINLSYYKNLGRYFALSVDGGVERRSARYLNQERHKTMPNINWWVRYSNTSKKVTVYVSGSVSRGLYVTPQEVGWGNANGFSVSAQKTIQLRKASLLLLAMWRLPLHIRGGEFKRDVDCEAYKSVSWSDNQFRLNNMLQFTAVFRFNGGEKTRKYDHSIETVE